MFPAEAYFLLAQNFVYSEIIEINAASMSSILQMRLKKMMIIRKENSDSF